ncbi:MAG: hypothetical protein VX899_26285 [Myxococcota bacterium]|nr:hypothetical protein [Myxococcota bacterium]
MTLSLLSLLTPVASADSPSLSSPMPISPTAVTLDRYVLAAKKKGAKKKKPHWESDWYVTPGGGAQVFNSGGTTTTTVNVGGEAGLAYSYVNTPLPRWSGKSRVAANYIVSASDGANAEGLDVRAGTFIGPSWKTVGVQAGPDLFYNSWTYRSVELEPTFGAELPVTVHAQLNQVQAYAGVSPAWVDTKSRRVDWDTVDSPLPGIGHEFTYLAGITGVIGGVSLNGQYSYRITAAGPQQTAMVSAQVSGATVWDLIESMQTGELPTGTTGTGSGSGDTGSDDVGSGGGRR